MESKDLIVVAKESLMTKFNAELEKFDLSDKNIEEFKTVALAVKVENEKDKDNAKTAGELRKAIAKKRIDVEKVRKQFKAIALDLGKAIDEKPKDIFEKIEPIEKHLKEQEEIVTKYEARLLEEARAKEAAEAEAKRIAFEEAQRKLAEEKEAFEKEKREAEEKIRREQEKVEIEKRHQEELKKQAEDAEKRRIADIEAEKVKAQFAKDQEEKRIKEAKEAEEKRLQQAGDKEKVIAYFSSLSETLPELKDAKTKSDFELIISLIKKIKA